MVTIIGSNHKIPQKKFIREVIFGANDGFVSIIALVAGVAGGTSDNSIILLAGMAGIFAGTISMGMGAYLAAKSQKEMYEKEIAQEKIELKNQRKKEINELYEIYRKKGFKGKTLKDIVRVISSNQKVMLDVMLKEELGLESEFQSPSNAGLVAGLSFLAAGFVPVLPFFFSLENPLFASIILTSIILLIVGAIKTIFTGKKIIASALETLIVGAIATLVTYGVGTLFGLTGI